MTPGPRTEQLLIQVAARALDELVVAIGSASPASGARDQAREALGLALAQLWHHTDGVELRCMSDGLWWDETLALSVAESASALIPTLSSAGILSLHLEPGVERTDIGVFADLVDEKAHRDEHSEKDLLMLLFRADLEHLRCCVRGTRSPDAGSSPAARTARPRTAPVAPPQRPANEALRDAIRADATTPRGGGVVRIEDFDSTLYFLDEREIEYLRLQVQTQYSTDHARSALALLFDTLELQTDTRLRDEVIGAIRAFLPYLLGSGRYDSVAYLTEELRTALRGADLEGRHRTALTRILQSLSGRGAVIQIFLTLDDGSAAPTAEGLEALVRQLDRAALETVLVWGGQLRSADAKVALLHALEEVFRTGSDRLTHVLASGDRAVVQSGLAMASKIRDERLVDGLNASLGHEDATIRRQAVEVLRSIPGPAAMRGVAGALGDADAGVRMAAYEAFITRPYRSVARILRDRLSSTDLEAVGLSERKLLFSAYGAVVGTEDVDALSSLLSGKRFFGRRGSSETRACAALALARIETPSARKALDAATRCPDPVVRNAAMAALRDGS